MSPACARGLGSKAVLAVILETADPERLYTGLSLAVSAAAEGESVRVLLGFGALGRDVAPGTHVIEAEREAFSAPWPSCGPRRASSATCRRARRPRRRPAPRTPR